MILHKMHWIVWIKFSNIKYASSLIKETVLLSQHKIQNFEALSITHKKSVLRFSVSSKLFSHSVGFWNSSKDLLNKYKDPFKVSIPNIFSPWYSRFLAKCTYNAEIFLRNITIFENLTLYHNWDIINCNELILK